MVTFVTNNHFYDISILLFVSLSSVLVMCNSYKHGQQFIDHMYLAKLERILNKQTPDKFYFLKCQLINFRITSADILKDVISLIFDKAVLEPTFFPMYAQLLSDLNQKLSPFPSDEPGGKEITFQRVLINICQEAFEGAGKLREELRLMTAPEQETERRRKEALLELRTLGNIRLCGELLKRNTLPEMVANLIVLELLGPDRIASAAEDIIESICLLFSTTGKQLDEHTQWRRVNDSYFADLKVLITQSKLSPRLKNVVRDVIDLRSNNWGEEVIVKTMNELHLETEKKPGLRPGTCVDIRNNRGVVSGSSRNTSRPGVCPISRPWFGNICLMLP